ncbi:MAG: hypothetical protein ACOC44_14130, partial [Promethearchaeia archaeon]
LGSPNELKNLNTLSRLKELYLYNNQILKKKNLSCLFKKNLSVLYFISNGVKIGDETDWKHVWNLYFAEYSLLV